MGLFAENSHRWLIVDQAVMMCGGVDVVRGASAPVTELLYILEDSQCSVLIAETPQLMEKILDSISVACAKDLQCAVLLYGTEAEAIALQGKLKVLPVCCSPFSCVCGCLHATHRTTADAPSWVDERVSTTRIRGHRSHTEGQIANRKQRMHRLYARTQ